MIWVEVDGQTSSITFSNNSLNSSGCATGVAVVQSFTPRRKTVRNGRRLTWWLGVGSACVRSGRAGVDDQQFVLLGWRARLTLCSSCPVTSRHRNFELIRRHPGKRVIHRFPLARCVAISHSNLS